MKFSLTIDLDNDAFQGGNPSEGFACNTEVARLLREAASAVERFGAACGNTLRDANGNRCGRFGICPTP
jgi:hypothetical protein